MLDFEAARSRVLAASSPLGVERAPLLQALGRVLREDLTAESALPAFDYSAMDGYCLSSADLVGSPPYELPVTGESRTGHPCPPLEPGAALRVFTGARVPPGADTLVIQENTERSGDRVRILVAPAAGEHLRRRGEDLPEGVVALAAGTRLGAFQLGLAAALDRAELVVSRRPRLVILPTGDELRPPGSSGAPESIPESNGVVLAALATLAGAAVELGPRLGDDLAPTREALEHALGTADVVVTIGGISVGDHDRVRPALERAGVTLDFWKVAIQPGKPFAFGRRGRCHVLGLPGNPVSAQLTFLLFGMPLVRALQGDSAPVPQSFSVELASALRRKPGRLGVYRARLAGGRAYLAAQQSSGATTSLATADGVVFVPAETSELAAGSTVEALRLDAC